MINANIKMTTNGETIELNEIECGIANMLYAYITNQLKQEFHLEKTYQLNPVELCKFINSTNEAEIDWEGEVGFNGDSELYWQSFYFFENQNAEKELKAFQNNQYLFKQYLNDTSKLEVSFE